MAKQSRKQKRKSIPRQTRRFQLRKDHAIDSHVAEILDYKRSKRAEVTAIRDGVRLLWALENNDLSVLFEMFPHMKPQVSNGGAGGTEDKGAILDIFLERLKTDGYLMVSNPAPSPQSAQPPTTGKSLSDKQFALPVFDDDDEGETQTSISTQKNNSTLGTDNFLRSLGGVSSKKDDPVLAIKKSKSDMRGVSV